MKKKIVKAVFDIAHANGVDIGVGMDMFNHNIISIKALILILLRI